MYSERIVRDVIKSTEMFDKEAIKRIEALLKQQQNVGLAIAALSSNSMHSDSIGLTILLLVARGFIESTPIWWSICNNIFFYH